MTMLDEHSPVPLYYQLKSILEQQIDSGYFQPGEKIPSENKLCKQYKISRTTVRQAIYELVNISKLIRTQGCGTFAANSRVSAPFYKLSGFSQDMKSQGRIPHSKILQLTPMLPPAIVAEKLQINENEAVISIKRVRYADDEVIGLAHCYFPLKRYSNLLDENLENNSLYETLIEKYDTNPSRSISEIEAIKCPREIADLLQITPADPILHLSETVYDQNNLAFEYGDHYNRGDRYIYHTEIHKQENRTKKGVLSRA